MLTKIGFVIGVSVAASALQAQSLTPPLGRVELFLIESPSQSSTLTLEPVPVNACEAFDMSPYQRLEKCAVTNQGSWTFVNESGDAGTLTFDSFSYLWQPYSNGTDSFSSYQYVGTWTKVVGQMTLTSPAVLEILFKGSHPENLLGSLELKAYDIRYPIQGRRL